MLAASPRAESARDFLALPGEMPEDGVSRECRPPRPAQKSRGDFVIAEEMQGDGNGHRCWPPRPAQKPPGTSWRLRARCQATATAESVGRRDPHRRHAETSSSPGEMPGNVDGHRCWRPRPAQKPLGNSWQCRASCQATATDESQRRRAPARKPRGDFFVAEEMPGNGDGHTCWPPRPAQKPRGTSWRLRAICRAMATDESVGRRAPLRSRAGTSLSPRRCQATAMTIRVGRLAPHRSRGGLLGAAGRYARPRRQTRV